MNSVVGLTGNHTMKPGKVKGEDLILIDSGATQLHRNRIGGEDVYPFKHLEYSKFYWEMVIRCGEGTYAQQ